MPMLPPFLLPIVDAPNATDILVWIHGASGIDDTLASLVRTLAGPTTSACLIDLYFEHSIPANGLAEQKDIIALHKSMSTQAVLDRIQTTVRLLRVSGRRLHVIGESFGGYWATRSATLDAPPDRVVALYPTLGTYVPPIESLAESLPCCKCAVQFHRGDKDTVCPENVFEILKHAAPGSECEFHVHRDADHGYIHHPGPARDATIHSIRSFLSAP